MPTDRYIKTVLTVIAIALVTIVLQNSTKSSFAAGQSIMKVVICDPEGNDCAGVRNGQLIIYGHTY